MSRHFAEEISEWHYDSPYLFYDIKNDPEDVAELFNPENWGKSYWVALTEKKELAGYFVFIYHPNEKTLELGLGLKPDLTGQGLGENFIQQGIDFARSKYNFLSLSLKVWNHNRRAIKCYKNLGFKSTRSFRQVTNGGEYSFVEMIKTFD